jgi:glutamyl-tRNA reductase
MITLIGVSHQSAPLALRERMAYKEDGLMESLQDLTARKGVSEAVILSTCNRVEVLARVEPGHHPNLLADYLVETGKLSAAELESSSYRFEGDAAVRHVFRVASGLESMVLGEPQILGQMKTAYGLAREAGSVGPILDRLMRDALSGAKKIRTETGIARLSVSIASAAVDLARKIFGDLTGQSALLLGAGQMGDLVATHLVSRGVERLVVSSRTYTNAAAFAEKHNGTACNWSEFPGWLEKVDIVVTGTAASHIVLEKEVVQKAIRARRNRPLFVIDIAVPRDVDPAVNDLNNVYLYDIDDLQTVVDKNLHERRKAAELAQKVVEEEVRSYRAWLEALKVSPTLIVLRESMHRVGASEFERFRKKIGPLNREQELQVHNLLRSVVQKLLHPPVRYLKDAARRGDTRETVSRYQEIFDIEVRQEDESPRQEKGTGPTHLLEGGREPES